MRSLMDEGQPRLTVELGRELERSVAEQLDHPFVRGLADGTLPAEAFRRFIRQDYLFLLDYSRALELAAGHAPVRDVGARLSKLARETATRELALHRAYADEWGIEEAELEREQPTPATRAYTAFLLDRAGAGFPEAVAALLPCMWGYSEVGRRLVPPRDDRYAPWIALYASAEFAELAAWCRDVVDAAALDADEPTRARMREAFATSCRHELAFWEAAWRG
jgi:thiaminase/transcriptional activator TenA